MIDYSFEIEFLDIMDSGRPPLNARPWKVLGWWYVETGPGTYKFYREKHWERGRCKWSGRDS